MDCPECQSWLRTGARSCSCGWKKSHAPYSSDPNHGKCSWKDAQGYRCPEVGVVSPTLGEPSKTISGQGSNAKWYCAWHYECLTRHLKDNQQSKEYAEWKVRDTAYDLQYGRKDVRDHSKWDDSDQLMVKGLLFFGEDSRAWKEAAKHCPAIIKKALALRKGGAKPTVGRTIAKEETDTDAF